MLELARPEGRQEINAICVQCHALHVQWRPDIYKIDEELYDEEWFLEGLKEKQIYVAKLHGVIVGYLRYRIRDVDHPGSVKRRLFLLDEFAVEESCRNQGIGTEMMQDVCALARAFGCTDMQMSVYPQNEAALALYRKCGFTIRNISMQRKV